MLKAALGYAELGIAVLPMRPGKKTPLTRHGSREASREPVCFVGHSHVPLRVVLIGRRLEVLDSTAVPALYWFAANYGKWGVAKGFTTLLKYKDMIKGVMDRVHSVNPRYFHGAADRYLGAYFSKTPSFAGGDMKKSKAHFEASLKRAPHYFGTKVLMANGSERAIEGLRPGDLVRGGRGGINRVVGIERPRLGGRQLYAFNGGEDIGKDRADFLGHQNT